MIAADLDRLCEQWEAEGWIRAPQLIDPDRAGKLRSMAESALAQWRHCDPETGEPGGFEAQVVMRHLNHAAYFAGQRAYFIALLELIADPAVLDVARAILQDEPLFRCTSLFFNPLDGSQDGNWHRDCQFSTKTEQEERAVFEKSLNKPSNSIQLQIALVPSSDSQYIPGSHKRWDSDEEHHIRRADGNKRCQQPMPGSVRVDLQPGDAVAFDPMGIHRGRYHADKYRRTLMLTYTADSRSRREDPFTMQPWCLTPGYLDGLSDHAREFFEHYIEVYRPFWERAAP